VRTLSLVSLTFASFALACGCSHEANPALSAATLTSTTVVAPPAGAPVSYSDADAGPSLDPDGPTAKPGTLTSFIADAPPLRADPVVISPLDRWSSRYPDAARLLAEWTEAHGSTASRLARWADRHPDHMATLVDWAITNVGDPLGALFINRVAWDDLRGIVDRDGPAVEDFILWTRRAPAAARELAAHPEGLAFAMTHEAQLARAHSQLGAP
jgi:hypothetical protein